MSIILSKKLEDEVLKDNFPSSFSIEPKSLPFLYQTKKLTTHHELQVIILLIF